MAADSVQKVGQVSWKADRDGAYRLRAQVRGTDNQAISENLFEFRVTPPAAAP
jgi:hypothetical protein